MFNCFIPDGVHCYIHTSDTLSSPTARRVPRTSGTTTGTVTETYETSGHTTSPITTHPFSATGSFKPRLQVHRGSETSATFTLPYTIVVSSGTPTPPPPTPSISITGASSGQVDQSLTFTGSGQNGCSPTGTWTWNATGGGAINGSGASVIISWPSAGPKSVTATNSACASATPGSKSVTISDGSGGPPGGGNVLGAAFSFTPSSVAAGQTVSFDASASSGGPTSFSWDFGDGQSASGSQVSHTYAKAGSYQVKLTVGKAGTGTGCQFGVCSDSSTKTVSVTGEAPLAAAFDVDASCIPTGGTELCTVDAGQTVSFTDKSTGKVTSRAWEFGDGATAQGSNVQHAYSDNGNYTATLTVHSATETSSVTKVFKVSGAPPQTVSRTVVLPWLAQADADKALTQSSDLYVNNPGSDPMTVEIVFHKQGVPEPDPPTREEVIAPNATLYLPDVIAGFNRSNIKGFLSIEPTAGEGTPVVTSFNRTFQADGSTFGQVVPGMPLEDQPQALSTGTPQVVHLVGLNNISDRLSYFGISNPSDKALHYNLRFFDSLGNPKGSTAEPLVVAAFGLKQWQENVLADTFGVANEGDYRIEIEPTSDSPRPFAYGANLRLPARDPSFVRAGRTDSSDLYLVGALNTPGLNGSLFQTDVVLSNPSAQVATCTATYTPTGVTAETTPPLPEITLQPRASLRLPNIVSEWNVGSSVGVLAIHCDSGAGVFPVAQAESYDVSNPSQLYGQFMPALTAADAAVPGKPLTLAGLRQNDVFRTTLWLYNPGDQVATYNVRYFDLDGHELPGETGVHAPPGKFRQINPGALPLPEGGVPDGFTARIEVTSGKLLAAGQVVNDSNDPAYIVGQ